jgi:large repetitive protein
MKNSMHKHLLTGMAAIALSASTAIAATTTLNTTDSGWYDNTGFHNPSNQNYFTGDNSGSELRSFFTFDLSSIAPTVTSATLRLYNQAGVGYVSPNASETFNLFDVTTPIASLTAGTGGVGAFADLGMGISYGTRVVSAADNGTTIEFTLNAAAIAAINAAAGSSFALGGALSTLDGVANTEAVFRFSQNPPFIRELVLNNSPTRPAQGVPDAGSTALLALMAFLPLSALARKSRTA